MKANPSPWTISYSWTGMEVRNTGVPHTNRLSLDAVIGKGAASQLQFLSECSEFYRQEPSLLLFDAWGLSVTTVLQNS
jgi:hypothetical protein